jgi:hypothetical protein
VSVPVARPARPARSAAPAALTRLRRTSLAVLVLIVAEFAVGMYVNLYTAVPPADHGGSLPAIIANGPAALSVHAALGLLLGLGAVAVLVQAIRARRAVPIAASALGLLALAIAALAGASFASTPARADSMAMSVMTAVALLCYAANLAVPAPIRDR